MTRIYNAIKKPYVWIFASVVYVWLLGLGKLIATLGPPFVILLIAHTKNSFWLSDFRKAFLFYAQEVANKLGYKYEYVFYSLLANILIFIPAVVIGFFVLRKKLWARNTFIGLVLSYIVHPIAIGLLSSESILGILSLNSIIFAAILCLLLRKSTKKVFLGGRSI
jgi:hypothetical protein